MSKRVSGKSGKRGRGVKNRQYCREHGMELAKKWRQTPKPKDEPKTDFWS